MSAMPAAADPTRPTPALPTPDDVAAALEAVRTRAPLVQCLTNIVVAQWTANTLLALGAAPAVVDNPREAAELASVADGVLVNLGTPYAETVAAMGPAVAAARGAGTPWVLDPVAAGALSWRTDVAQGLLAAGPPAILRGNASEVLALAGGDGGRGVDAVHTPEAAADSARATARRHGTVVAVSGPVDHVVDAARLVRVTNGHPWLTRVTGVGCALGATMAAFAAAVDDPLLAAVAATAVVTVAAESAAARTAGPGSFAVALLDDLAACTPEHLAARVSLA
ncbi:hydroxyethylthiazole kinase [Actinotalea fermentans]|uniref:Hydroxyethylthiazole kinase n=1 Tax=Actinotalea fermentans TaxID=43671 RepID=A0A511Z1B4_9CELL|nr:hydroxyethylthiazole kinase [Actinotalea fermentans]